MKALLISLIIGLIAAAIDTVPMVLRKLDGMFILSAFFFWLVLGFLIPRTTITDIAWLNGILAALIVLVPTLFLVVKLDPQAIPVMIGTSVVLGAAVGFVSAYFIA